ncbi:hypothetical protein CR969_01160 [Candidatus Saccharibacteria bacterium]|nr:MAG: hypothetical protein CR969_01160 [Candidatus Saccharibacteria bacterium]
MITAGKTLEGLVWDAERYVLNKVFINKVIIFYGDTPDRFLKRAQKAMMSGRRVLLRAHKCIVQTRLHRVSRDNGINNKVCKIISESCSHDLRIFLDIISISIDDDDNYRIVAYDKKEDRTVEVVTGGRDYYGRERYEAK